MDNTWSMVIPIYWRLPSKTVIATDRSGKKVREEKKKVIAADALYRKIWSKIPEIIIRCPFDSGSSSPLFNQCSV